MLRKILYDKNKAQQCLKNNIQTVLSEITFTMV